jgi:tyrosyl-DNA phosphodiesterase-1
MGSTQKSDISFAILSSYSLALSWIYEFFDRETPVIMVAHDAGHPEVMHNVFPNWIRTVPKLHNGRGCMHMKVSRSVYDLLHVCSMSPFHSRCSSCW